jgi:hypothetical protein
MVLGTRVKENGKKQGSAWHALREEGRCVVRYDAIQRREVPGMWTEVSGGRAPPRIM